MLELALVVFALLVIGLFDLVSIWFGADSRDGNDWAHHGPL